MDDSLRLIDLIPRRLTTFALWFLAGLTVVVGLEALYAWMPDLAPMTTDGRVAAFDLDGEGSLAAWFSSVVLVLACLGAIMVYAIRRYKTDDYQGYYRIWVWAAMCWLLMSIDEAASLHEGFKEMMARVTGTPLMGDGSIWWVICYGFLLGAVGSRLLIDMRTCRLSSAALLTAGGCYLLAVVTQLGWLLPESGARGVMVEEGAEMIGNLLLLLAMGLHARYVILDAEGLLSQRKTESDEELDAELEEEGEDSSESYEEWIKVDASHSKLKPARKKRTARASQPVSKSEPEETIVRRKLTKAERKTLRKRLTEERLQREREQRQRWGKG